MSDRAAFEAAVDEILARRGDRRARFGLAVHALAGGAPVFERDAHSYFQGASTTKIPTTASALAALGAEFRFRTVVRHTGHIDDRGTLHGDLVLVASGDPNVSARVRADDTLAFCDVDHMQSGMPGAARVAGDALAVLRKLVDGIAAYGIARVTGRVCIDVSLFPEGYREPGSFAVVSPIVVNDNVIDIVARGASVAGGPVELEFAPATRYATFVSSAVTSAAGDAAALRVSSEERDAAGGRVVRIAGSIPAGTTQTYVHPVDSPSTFTRTLLVELLTARGIAVDTGTTGPSAYSEGTERFAPAVLAEHVSPPFAQAAKIVLKVSQNLHAELCPRIVGALVAGVRGDGAEAAGFARLTAFLTENGVDCDGMLQGDSCGMYGFYTPDFMCRLLRAIDAHPMGAGFRNCLPVLGRDGTLHDIVSGSAAAGHVFAKTGTHGFDDRIRPRTIVQAKGLAGYIDAASGGRFVFAAYLNNLPLAAGQTWSHAGNLLGEIAAAAYHLL